IVSFEVLLNVVDRSFLGSDYHSNFSSSERNLLHRSWGVDKDPYSTNQFGHPYQGSMYHGFARSAGLGYWESVGYTFLGSALWEIAGETTHPSINDQVASGIAGSFLGEALFRTANLLIDKSGGDVGVGRGLLVLLLSPPTGLNRAVFGD